MDLDKIAKYVAAVCLIAGIALGLFILFNVGLVMFTAAAFAIVFGLGVVVGIYLASRLYIACSKSDE